MRVYATPPKPFAFGPFIFVVMTAVAFCAFILSLPLFPTHDGPVHLYYARVMQALIFHRDPGIFAQYYTIKHLVPPYAVYYYLLLGFGHFTTLVVADKLIVCLYVVLFLFGFRYFARAVGPHGDLVALLSGPLLLNWPLGMGFLNFCLSIAIAFWALGLWCRVSQRPQARGNGLRLAAFVFLCFLIMLTHPVPLLLVLGFCAIELIVRVRFPSPAPARNAALVRDGIVLLLGCSSLLYVKAFTVQAIAKQANEGGTITYLQSLRLNAPYIIQARGLLAFSAHDVLGIVDRLAMFALFLVPAALALLDIRRSLKLGIWTLANTFGVLSILLFLVLPVLPPDLNEAHLFSARLVIFVWLTALAGACGGAPESHGKRSPHFYRTATMLMAGIFNALILLLGFRNITPIARRIALFETAPLIVHERVVLLVEGNDYGDTRHTLTYDPFLWVGMRVIRRADSVLYNIPWLSHSIIPIGAKANVATGKIAEEILEAPPVFRARLAQSPEFASLVFSSGNTLLFTNGSNADTDVEDPVLALNPARTWACKAESVYVLCSAAH